MNTKKLVWILSAAFLIFLSIGILSFRYNDGFKLVNFIRETPIHIESDDSLVNIGDGKIDIIDKDNHVVIGWDGIKVKTPKENVEIGWDGIKVEDGKSKFSINNIFNFRTGLNYGHKRKLVNLDEKLDTSLKDIRKIGIVSSFVDISIKPHDKEDLFIHYHGSMETSQVPQVKIDKKGGALEIVLENPDSNTSYSVTNSNVVLEISVPTSYKGSISSIATSGDIYLNDIKGESFYLSTMSGDTNLDSIEGKDLKLMSSSGDHKIIDSTGKIDLTSSSGSILISGHGNEDMTITTSSGDVNIGLEKDANYTITGTSLSGNFTSQISMVVEEKDHGSFKGKIGNGDNRIDISTSSGSVKFIN